MRHRVSGKKLRRDTAHRMALLRNLVTSFLEKERIRTTLAKAKAARPLAEKMITLGKKDTLHARRQALRFIYKKEVVRKLFNEIGPRFSERPGGYTRIIKIGPRAGDGAEMAILEMVGTEFKKKEKKKEKTLKEKVKAAKEAKR
ncbi:50S ribosomal protein L17 [Candidatus Aminicenantes bacterium AC-334-K16]|nr:50S ribosomal protein L17 [Candidatus Aminicenantes bacterium AC-334-K16]